MRRWLGGLLLFAASLAIVPGVRADSVHAGTTIYLVVQPGPVQITGQPGSAQVPMQGGPLAFFYPPGANLGVVFVSSGTIPDTISIEIVTMSLVSTMPVQIGSSFFDVSVQGSSGQLSGSMNFNSDGTFDSSFHISLQITFTDTSTGQQTIQTEIVPMQFQGTWATNIPGGHVEQLSGTLTCFGQIIRSCQLPVDTLTAPVPEPGTLALLSSGLAVIFVRRRNSRKPRTERSRTAAID